MISMNDEPKVGDGDRVAQRTSNRNEVFAASNPGRRARLVNFARRARPWQVFLMSLVLIFGMHATWALLTPPGGSPDEIAHIAKAAGVAHGQVFGEDVDGTQLREFEIPAGIRAATDNIPCTILHGNVPASCDPTTVGEPEEMIPVISSAGLYNPVFYVAVGWPTLIDHGQGAIFAMRLLGGFFNAVFFALALTCLSLLPRARIVMLAAIGIITPSVAFLGGMVNPNALEISTVGAFAAALIAALRLEARGPLLWRLCAIMAVAGMLAVHARSLAPLWIFAAVVIVGLIAGWRAFWGFLRQAPTLIAVALVIVSTGVALGVVLSTGTLNEMGDYEGQGTRWDVGLRTTLFLFFDKVTPMVGAFGWNDAVIPDFAVVTYLVMVVALVFAAVIGTDRWQSRVGVFVAMASVTVLPAIVQGASVTNSGYIWQGRYGLAIVFVLVYIAAVVAIPVFERMRRVIQNRTIATVIILLALTHVAGLQVMLHRYGSGTESEYSQLILNPAWSPFGLPMIVPIVGVWILVAVWALAAALVVQTGDHDRLVRGATADRDLIAPRAGFDDRPVVTGVDATVSERSET